MAGLNSRAGYATAYMQLSYLFVSLCFLQEEQFRTDRVIQYK